MGSMDPMPHRLPDKLFRDSGAAETADARKGGRRAGQPRGRSRSAPKVRDVREFAPPMVMAGLVGALLLGFGVGKLVSVQASAPPEPQPSTILTSAAFQPTPSIDSTMASWSGPVRVVDALAASGRCLDGMGITVDVPANLVDDDPDSLWRCSGSGVGESVSFTLPEGEDLVGIRLVNGNTSSYDRYLAERRILSVKWEFSDGSWVVQPLAANDREPQELRFSPTTVTGAVTMTVLDATVPGETSESGQDTAGRDDAVSISSLTFLAKP